MPPGLDIAAELTLPADAAVHSFALLGMRGSGKSNAGVVLAEQLTAAGMPWVAVDPKGDWWGVRSSATEPGLPAIIFGGLHADIPLSASQGEQLADLIAENRLTCVLDVSEMSKREVSRFLTRSSPGCCGSTASPCTCSWKRPTSTYRSGSS